jgi:hypothetical protein
MMQRIKFILSFLLLISIFGGMVHNVSPYCLNGDNVYFQLDNNHKHEHPDHEINKETNHKHVQHDNHLDEGYFDLLVCVLNDVEIPSDDCDFNCFVLWNHKESQFDKNKLKLLVYAIASAFTEINVENTIQNISNKNNDIYTTPSLEHSPHRGPPIFSC